MGTWTEHDRTDIDATMSLFKEKCLVGDGSLLWPEEAIWTQANLTSLQERYRGNPMYGVPGTFDEKLQQQLEDCEPTVRKLAAETLVIYYLFATDVITGPGKRKAVTSVLEAGGLTLPDTQPVVDALDKGGIGSPGPGWLFNRPTEYGFLLDVVRAWKTDLADGDRESLVADPWKFEAWLDALPDATNRQVRHVLLHLLFPTEFERIASGGHKRTLVALFGGLLAEPSEDEDRSLRAIRDRMRDLLKDTDITADDQFDFYRDPVRTTWHGGDPENLSGLWFKRQLVLFGPPGTGKSHEARELANGLIRQAALNSDAWGPARVFSDADALNKVIRRNIHKLQLHPAYSYEDFIRGLVMGEDGKTTFQAGYLMRLVDTINEQRANDGADALPHVLILDELNRADLSRVLGEAFSLLENREEPVELPGVDPDDEVTELALPKDLYVIGTMNLIDQSVEQVDFALRRRFLWRESRFRSDVLRTVLEERWRKSGQATDWERVQPHMDALVGSATNLNARIAAINELGERYEIGHTYFFDIVDLLARRLNPGRKSTAKYFLWDRDAPAPPLQDLWDLALKPLVSEYLAGVDADERKRLVEELRDVFMKKS